MKKHLTYQQIIGFHSGLVSVKEKELIENHLDSCTLCSERSAVFSDALRAKNKLPGDHVKKRILDSYDALELKRAEKPYRRKTYLYPVTAAAAILVIVGSVFLLRNHSFYSSHIQMTVAEIRGSASVNGVVILPGQKLGDMNRIVTGEDSSVTLEYHDSYTLTVGSLSEMNLALNGSVPVTGDIVKGIIVSKSHGGPKYSYTSGKYTVEPLGTELSLVNDDGNVSVLVKEGRVSVKAKESVSGTIVAAGEKLNTRFDGETEKLEDNDAAIFRDINSYTKAHDEEFRSSSKERSDTFNGQGHKKKTQQEITKNNSDGRESTADDKKSAEERKEIHREKAADRKEKAEIRKEKSENRKEKRGLGKLLQP